MFTVKLGSFPGGMPYIEWLPTMELTTDPPHVLIPDGLGGVVWVPLGSLSGVGSPLMWGCFNISEVASPLYLPPGYGADSVATSIPIEMRAPRAGVLKNFYVRQNIIAGAPTQTVTYTVMKNGIPTALQVSIVCPAQDGDDQVHTVTVAKGDRLSMLVSKSAVFPSPVVGAFGIVATVEFD